MWLVFWAVIDRTGQPGRRAEDRLADQAALERIARGDHDALADLYDRHARSVYSLAVRIVRDQADAEDIVQEVFSQAWRQAGRYDASRGNVAAWLMTLTRSRAIDHLRGRKVRPWETTQASAEVSVPDLGLSPDAQAVSAEQVVLVRTALDALPLTERMALELAYFEGHTHAEIAALLE